jgi:hypothetical protein
MSQLIELIFDREIENYRQLEIVLREIETERESGGEETKGMSKTRASRST